MSKKEINWGLIAGIIILLLAGWFVLTKVPLDTFSSTGGGTNEDGNDANDDTPCPSWNGVCTNQIENVCCEDCMDVRMCAGQVVSDPMECLTKYCSAEGHFCEPVWDGDGGEFLIGKRPSVLGTMLYGYGSEDSKGLSLSGDGIYLIAGDTYTCTCSDIWGMPI